MGQLALDRASLSTPLAYESRGHGSAEGDTEPVRVAPRRYANALGLITIPSLRHMLSPRVATP